MSFEKELQSVLLDLQYDGLSPNSLVSYRTDLSLLIQFLKDTYHLTSFVGTTRDMMQHYLAVLYDNGVKETSVSRKISAFRKVFTQLKMQQVITTNPMDVIALPKKRKKLPVVLSEAEIEAILATPDLTTNAGIRDKAMLEVFYATGLRVSELATLKLSQLHLAQYQIDVIGKGNKARLVLIGEEAIQALESYLSTARVHLLKGNESDYVFLNQRGKPLTRQGIWKMIKAIVVNAGITKNVTPHTLRHSVATHLLSHGMSLRLIQEMLGHENLVTTEIYTHIDRQKIIEEYRLYHPHSKKENNHEI